MIDTYRASGAGGQHINKTDSAVRITHLPTNIVVQCQTDRSQHRNRAEAMAMLKSKLYELELRKRQAEQQKLEDSKTDIGWGHQIRSYVLDQSRIKDLRTNYEVGNTQAVLDGGLEDFIAASLKQGVYMATNKEWSCGPGSPPTRTRSSPSGAASSPRCARRAGVSERLPARRARSRPARGA